MVSAERVKEIASRQWLPLPGVVSVGLIADANGDPRLLVGVAGGADVRLPSSVMGRGSTWCRPHRSDRSMRAERGLTCSAPIVI
jgi:hypothetical protein